MSKFYIQCPSCGANLDPGEKCECRTYKAQKQKMLMDHIKTDKKGQCYFDFKNLEAG